ncbi:MAG: MFS transporter [Thermoproteota archaeon]
MATDAGKRACSRTVAATSLAVVVLAAAAFSAARPAVAFLARMQGASMVMVSTLTSAFTAARATSAAIGGYLSDRRPKARIEVARFALAGFAAVVFAMYVFHSPLQLVLLMAAWGVLSGVYWPTLQVLVGLAGSLVGRPGLYTGLYFATSGLGSALGYQLYGLLKLPHEEMLLASALLHAAAAVTAFSGFTRAAALCRSARSLVGGPVSGARERRGLLLEPQTVWVLLASFVTGTSLGVTAEFMYVYLGEVQGLERGRLGSVLAAASALSILSAALAGRAADRFGLVATLRTVLLVNAAGFLMLASVSPAAAVVGVVVAFSAQRALMPLTRTVMAASSSGTVGTVVGASNTVSSLGASIAPLLAGALYERAESLESAVFGLYLKGAAFIVVAALSLVVAALPLASTRRIQGDGPRSDT